MLRAALGYNSHPVPESSLIMKLIFSPTQIYVYQYSTARIYLNNVVLVFVRTPFDAVGQDI